MGGMLLRKAEILGIPYRDEKILDAPEVTLQDPPGRRVRGDPEEPLRGPGQSHLPARLLPLGRHPSLRIRSVLPQSAPAPASSSPWWTISGRSRTGWRESKQWRGRLTRSEIVDWQNTELFVTQTMSAFLNRPCYMIPEASADGIPLEPRRPAGPPRRRTSPIRSAPSTSRRASVDPDGFLRGGARLPGVRRGFPRSCSIR